MVALNSSFAALAAFQPRDLFAFAVQLLNFLAEAARLLCGLGGVLSWIVDDDRNPCDGGTSQPGNSALCGLGESL